MSKGRVLNLKGMRIRVARDVAGPGERGVGEDVAYDFLELERTLNLTGFRIRSARDAPRPNRNIEFGKSLDARFQESCQRRARDKNTCGIGEECAYEFRWLERILTFRRIRIRIARYATGPKRNMESEKNPGEFLESKRVLNLKGERIRIARDAPGPRRR